MNGFRFAALASAFVIAVSLVTHAEGKLQSQTVEIQLQIGEMLFGEGRYQESLEAYRNAVKVASPTGCGRRAAESSSPPFASPSSSARVEAEQLIKESPRESETLALSATRSGRRAVRAG